MVDTSISPLQTSLRLFFVSGSSGQATSSRSEAPCKCFCWHLHPSLCDMTPQRHLLSLALKRKPLARGKRGPRVSSIVGWFSPPPSLESVVGIVVPPSCHLVLATA